MTWLFAVGLQWDYSLQAGACAAAGKYRIEFTAAYPCKVSVYELRNKLPQSLLDLRGIGEDYADLCRASWP